MSKSEIESKCYKFGRDYFGPFLYEFTKWINKEISLNSLKKVFFLSRDGYMMIRAYEIVHRDSEAKYVYFSRHSLRFALIYRCTNYEESLQYVTKEHYVSLSKLLKYYGFDEEERKKIFEKYNIRFDTDYLYDELRSNKQLKKIYEESADTIKARSLQQADILKKYLSYIGMNGNCAIVDIGWHGSMQYYLEKFAENENIELTIHGLYLGINPLYKTKGKMEGFLFDSDKASMRKKVLCFLGGYEKLFQSQEGSTIGYVVQENGDISPYYDRYEYEDRPDIVRRIIFWQKGAIDYITDSVNEVKKDSIYRLISFGMNPPRWGIEMFKEFYVYDGDKQWFVSDKPFIKYGFNELKHAISGSVWKTGFMKSLFRIPFPYFTIYKVIRK